MNDKFRLTKYVLVLGPKRSRFVENYKWNTFKNIKLGMYILCGHNSITYILQNEVQNTFLIPLTFFTVQIKCISPFYIKQWILWKLCFYTQPDSRKKKSTTEFCSRKTYSYKYLHLCVWKIICLLDYSIKIHAPFEELCHLMKTHFASSTTRRIFSIQRNYRKHVVSPTTSKWESLPWYTVPSES